jgi:hypothetical protein
LYGGFSFRLLRRLSGVRQAPLTGGKGRGLPPAGLCGNPASPLTGGKGRACRLPGLLAYYTMLYLLTYILLLPVVFFALMIYNNRGAIFYYVVEFLLSKDFYAAIF